MKSLEKDRSRRYETANGLAADIRRYLDGEPVTAVPPSGWYRLRKFARRHRGVLSTATAFVGLLVIATVMSGWLAYWARRAESDAQESKREALTQTNRAVENLKKYQGALAESEKRALENLRLAETAEAASHQALSTVADMQTDRGFLADKSGDSATAALWFANAATLTPFDPDRQDANRIRAVNWLRHSILPTSLLSFSNDGAQQLAFQPNGPLFFAVDSRRLSLWDWAQEEALEWTDGLESVSDAAWSPDGERLAIASRNGDLSIREADSGRLRCRQWKPVIAGGPCRTIAFSPDSRWLATGVNGNNAVQVWSLQTGEAAGPAIPHPGDLYGIFSLAFSPDGERILSGHKDGKIRLWNWRTGELAGPLMSNAEEILSVAFSPDGKYALAAVRVSALHLWDLATGKPIAPPTGPLPAMTNSVIARNFTTGPMAITSSQAILTSDGFSIVDFTKLLTGAPETASLLRHAELSTNQTVRSGELAPLEPSDWDDRWTRYVASRVGTENLVSELASALDAAQDGSDRRSIAQRAVDCYVLPQLLAVRPDSPELLVVAARWASQRGDLAAAARHRDRAIAAFESRIGTTALDRETANAWTELMLERSTAEEWVALQPLELKSKSGCTLEVHADHSILAGKVSGYEQGETYKIRGKIPVRTLAQLRLDVLPHPDLPRGGPGWGGGNFVLSEFRASLRKEDGTVVPLELSDSISDVIRPLDSDTTLFDGPSGAIDGSHATRWDIWPAVGQSHWLKVKLRTPVALHDRDELVVELDCLRPMTSLFRLGYFRLSASEEQVDYLVDEMTSVRLRAKAGGVVRLAAAYLAVGDTSRAATLLKSTWESEDSSTLGLRLLLRARCEDMRGDLDGVQQSCRELETWLHQATLPPSVWGTAFDVLSRNHGLSRLEFNRLMADIPIQRELERLSADVARDSTSHEALAARGYFLTRVGRWTDSSADFTRILSLAPENRANWVDLAASRIMAGELDAYRALCRELTEADLASGDVLRSEPLGPNRIVGS